MPKMLIVDDEENICLVLEEYAKFSGFDVDKSSNGMTAIMLAKENDYDIIIMDIMMPKLDGYSAIKEIKKCKNTPILVLSARQEEYDKLFGFELGIDDYVVKPFSPKEVMARVNAIIKRNNKDEKRILRFKGLEIDMVGRNVIVDGVKAVLTPREYELLFYLVKNRGIAVSRESLLTEVWGYDFLGDDRTVDTHIKMLRGNLGPYRDFIVTLRGLGYKFEA